MVVVFDVTATTKNIVRQCIFPYYTSTSTHRHIHSIMWCKQQATSILYTCMRSGWFGLMCVYWLCSHISVHRSFAYFSVLSIFLFDSAQIPREREKKMNKIFFHFCLVAIAWFGIHCDYMHFVHCWSSSFLQNFANMYTNIWCAWFEWLWIESLISCINWCRCLFLLFFLFGSPVAAMFCFM